MMRFDEITQDLVNAEQRKAAELEELNTHFAAMLALFQQALDMLLDERKQKDGCGW